MTIKTSTKLALSEAVAKDVPYVAAFIEDGIATTYSSGTKTSEVLSVVAHALFQVVMHAMDDERLEELELDHETTLEYALEHVGTQAFNLLEQMRSFSHTAN
jgi:hypothetical protein